MGIERRIRSIGTKTVTYPWMRRYIVVGPYNRHVRRNAAAGVLVSLFEAAADRAGRRRAKVEPGHH